MKRLLSLVFALLASLAAAAAWAQATTSPTSLCPPSNETQAAGIGDGCSVPDPSAADYLFPNVGMFTGDFETACDHHDKCYSTLGTTYSQCDGAFLSDMRSACNAHYSPLLVPDLNLACMVTAQQFHDAVVVYGNVRNPLPGIQELARGRAIAMLRNQLAADKACGATPASTTLFDPSLVSVVNAAFQTYAHRQPTIFEFFDAVDAPTPSGSDIVYDRTNWQQITLVGRAIRAASFTPPQVAVQLETDYATTASVYPTPYIPGDSYTWGMNGGSAASVSLTSGTYNHTVRLTGFVRVAAPGAMAADPGAPGYNVVINPSLVTMALYDYGVPVDGRDGPCKTSRCKSW